MSVWLFPYKQGSRSATALATAMAVRTIKVKNSKFTPSKAKTIINWGSTQIPDVYVTNCRRVLNRPEAIKVAANKHTFFEAVDATEEAERPRIPKWTRDKAIAEEWFREKENLTVFARTVLNGHSGEGIVKVNSVEELQGIAENTLLVQYVPKRKEYRIHIAGEEAFILQEKKAARERGEGQEIDWQVRNHAGGFIFARENVEPDADVIEQAKRALKVTGLDFGAVDVIWNERKKEAYVLEVNTSPGLEGATLEDYSIMLGRMTEND